MTSAGQEAQRWRTKWVSVGCTHEKNSIDTDPPALGSMNPDAGLYGDRFDRFLNTWWLGSGKAGEGAAILSDLKSRIDSGDIVFAEGAVISLLGCNTANYPYMPDWVTDSFAENLSEIVPGAYIVGATARSSPEHETLSSGRKIDSNRYNAPGGVWEVWRNGQYQGSLLNPYDPTQITSGNIEENLQ